MKVCREISSDLDSRVVYVQVGGEKSNQINQPVILGLTEIKVLDGKSRIITELLF